MTSKDYAEILEDVVTIGLFTTMAWFVCNPTYHIWLLAVGWIMGTAMRVALRER